MRADQAVPRKEQVASEPRTGDLTLTDVAILPLPALGDLTIYLRLGWLLHCAGANVTFHSDALYPAREYFAWAKVLPEWKDSLEHLASRFHLVIAYRRQDKGNVWGDVAPSNVAFVAAKRISGDTGLDGQSVLVGGQLYPGASRPFCRDTRAAKTMVDWVDDYAWEVFGIRHTTNEGFLTCPHEAVDSDLVLIFPTTPEPKKNYWLSGFRLLALVLKKRGWTVEFICTPAEHGAIASSLPRWPVRSFPDIKALMDHVAQAAVVISNDSGGGHLGSLMGLATFTVTRRKKNFVWRPGFNKRNTVIYPWFRFKWLGKRYIWRPFVPVWRVVMQLGRRTRA